MKTRAAMLWDTGRDWEIAELDLDEPKQGEVLIRWVAAGLCHSDEHLRHGDIVPRFPIVGGHEGAGIIEEIGPGVSRVKVGDHVVSSFIPSAGTAASAPPATRTSATWARRSSTAACPTGRSASTANGDDIGAMCMLGTFSQYSVISETSCVSVDKDLPLETVVLVGCGVPTGWCSSVYAADVTPGETVIIYGIGGIGANAVQGASHAGAANLIAVDPLANKREMAEDLGATHTVASAEEAYELARN